LKSNNVFRFTSNKNDTIVSESCCVDELKNRFVIFKVPDAFMEGRKRRLAERAERRKAEADARREYNLQVWLSVFSLSRIHSVLNLTSKFDFDYGIFH
jgi:hypothetical protein